MVGTTLSALNLSAETLPPARPQSFLKQRVETGVLIVERQTIFTPKELLCRNEVCEAGEHELLQGVRAEAGVPGGRGGPAEGLCPSLGLGAGCPPEGRPPIFICTPLCFPALLFSDIFHPGLNLTQPFASGFSLDFIFL